MRTSWIMYGLLGLAAATATGGENRITHGPILGRPGSQSIGVWARTERPGTFRVRYGTTAEQLDQLSPPVATAVEHDLTGWVELSGLVPDTRYVYQVETEGSPPTPQGRFHTLPDPDQTRDPEKNPRGLFNFSFEFGCCNQQVARGREKVSLPVWDTALATHGERIHFAIQNGDWCYEEMRTYPVESWRKQVGLAGDGDTPETVRKIPLIVGAWENYKIYLERGESLSKWHRNVPVMFTYDDHEILDDAGGAGAVGQRPRRGLYRDIGVRAWCDYLGWSNPVNADGGDGDIHFGIGEFMAKGDVLVDPDADFSKLDLDQQGELHVHWSGPNTTKKEKSFDQEAGPPNAGVYRIAEVLDPHRLRIEPAARADGTAAYSIGRFSYFKQSISNCDFLFVDTRGHGDVSEDGNPKKPGISLLGTRQKGWLKREMSASQADAFFLVSTVNFMVPHVVDVGEEGFTNHIDSWPAFWNEREELIRFFEQLGKPVFILTGDLHYSFAIRISDRIWEFASAPHSSGNATYLSGGGTPPNGTFDSFGRECFIRWSTWFENRVASKAAPKKVYCIVSVNNVFRNPSPEKPDRVQAYPFPQVVFQYHDGFTGDLLYAESILVGDTGPAQTKERSGN